MLDASGDALYASDELLIEGGAISISCGGNGLRTDGDAQLLGGSVWIDESDVGLAGKRVTVENALINVTSGAEGILAQAGDEAADGVRIGEGAALTIDAGACGIATDARLLFEGGETVIRCAQRSYAPTSAQGGAYATGGTLIATGMSGDGADVAGDAAQPTLLARFSGTVGSGAQVVVEDEAGEAVISFTAQERFCVFQASCPQLRAGERYTLYLDGEAVGAVTVEGALNLFAPQDAPDAAPQPAPDVQPEQADEQDGTARI